MSLDPYVRAQMTQIVLREKELQRELEQLAKELPVWAKRVALAKDKNMLDLARQAHDKHDQMQQRQVEAQRELDVLAMERSVLRKQNRMPSGDEVARAEAMVEEVRLGGLVDPDRAKMEREEREKELAPVA